MFESVLGMLGENSGLIVGGGGSAVVLWVLKKIPNENICGVVEEDVKDNRMKVTYNKEKTQNLEVKIARIESKIDEGFKNLERLLQDK